MDKDILKKIKMKFSNKTKSFVPKDSKSKKKLIVWIVIIAAAAYIVWSSVYTVNDQERAVITTFGSVTGTADAGIHFLVPFGVQQAHIVEVNAIKRIEIGYRTTDDGSTAVAVENESKMITGDFNIVNIDFFIEYRITDPEKYLFSSEEPENVLKVLAQSQIRNVIGCYKIDSILTDKKEEIQIKVKELITQELEEYDIGLTLLAVSVQDSEPPTDEVREAFKAVETAKQGMETAKNDANAYANAKKPAAEAERNKLSENAEYLRLKRVNEAKEQIAMFEAMYSEYSLNPEITKSRMYYEMIEQVLPGVRVFIDTSDGEIQKLLPLDSLISASDG